MLKESNKWNVDGTEKWYIGTILDVVAGTSDWYNVTYDKQVLSLKGDLEFIDTEDFSSWA